MVKSIHIQNFRCFENLELEGFGRVNLIGGKNNSGKTVLLEGLLIGSGQNPLIIVELKRVRYSNQNVWEIEPRNSAWDDLFYNQDKLKEIIIESVFTDNTIANTTVKNSSKIFQPNAVIDISYSSNKQSYYKGKLSLNLNGKDEPEVTEISYDSKLMIKGGFEINYIVAKSFKDDRHILVNLFSQLELSGYTHYVLEALKIIDDTIVDVKIISLGEPNLYAKREQESLMPLGLFGDAIKKLAAIVSTIIDSKNGILLIDEIENGIHFTNQPKVWELIFKLAHKFNVQVFATTHSKEMAEAFNKIALEGGFAEEARYIEMARHGKTKMLVGLVDDMDMLKYKLDRNKAFRGE